MSGITRADDPVFSQKWVKEMAAYVKSLDPNHMVGVGEEGFYSTTPTRLGNNPGADTSPWAAAEGQDFIADHSSPDIDYAAFHSWIDRFTNSSSALQ